MTSRAAGRVARVGAILACTLLWGTGTLGADALREAAEALQNEDFAAAILHLEEALADDPGNVNARFNLAYALQAEGNTDGAIEHYRAIAEQQPDLLPARQNLATLLMKTGQFGAAAREYEALAGLLPEDPAILRLLAAARQQAGQHESAAEAFRLLLAAEPESLEAVLGLARALDAAGQLHEAVPQYLRAAAIDPGLLETLPEAARRLEAQGFQQDALELYRRYARARPEDAAAQEEVGILLLENGKLKAAVAALQGAVSLEPTFQRHAALAEAYRRAGDTEAAHEQLGLAARAAPGNSSARVRFASSLLQRQQFEDAAREFLAAAEADTGAADAWRGLAFAMFQIENFPASVRAIEQAERIGPLDPPTVYLRALALDKLQQYELAQASYQAFVAMQPAMPDEVWKAEQRLRTIEKVLRKR